MKKTVTMVLLTLSVFAMAQNSERQKYYFEKRMKEVKSSISLNKGKEQELTATYDELCKTQPNEEAEWLFKIAMRRVVNDSAKIIAVSENEVAKAAAARLPYNLEKVRIQKQLTTDQAKSLEALVLERDKAYRTLDYLYPENVEERVKADNRTGNAYSKKMELAYIRLGIASWLSTYAIGLRYIKELSLTDKQLDDFGEMAWNFSKIKFTDQEYKNRPLTEFNKTKQILSKEQFDTFIKCKVKDSDASDAQKVKLELENLKQQKQLTDEQAKSLEALVVERRIAKKEIEYTYPDITSEDRKNADKLANERFDKEFNMAYSRMGVSNNLMYGANALRYSKELNLKPTQIDSLSELGWKLTRNTPENKDVSLRGIAEHKRTKEILSKSQYDKFLECNVKNNVQKEVQKSWSEMKKYNMSAEIDSATVSKTLLPFYTERALINERYKYMAGGEEQKQVELENLNAMTPAILKKLGAVKNREKKKTALQPNALTW